MSSKETESLWREFFRDPSQFWDNRNDKVRINLVVCVCVVYINVADLMYHNREAQSALILDTNRQERSYG